MKTLDEVIEELQYWDTCNEYPECFYDDEVTRDVLNYLKEYKRVQNKIEKIALGNIEDTLDKLDNKPLTWDELKTMEGKPVWVEYDNHLSGRKRIKYKVWDVIDLITEDLILVKGDYSYQKDEFGDVWQAYRKENNGR